MKSEVSYLEFGAGDAGKARAFLGQLFGWDFHLMGTGPEGWFQTPSMKAGLHGNDPTPGILVFFSVPDLEEAIAKVRELGGEADEPSEEDLAVFALAATRKEFASASNSSECTRCQ